MFNFLRNWRTTIAGVIIAVLTGLRFAGKISPEIFDLIVSALAAAGLIAAQDGNAPPPAPQVTA